MPHDDDERRKPSEDGTDQVPAAAARRCLYRHSARAARGRPQARRRIPGDDKFGDPIPTRRSDPGKRPPAPPPPCAAAQKASVRELGLAGLQVWQSLSEATGCGHGDVELAILFTDLVEFSSWELKAGDAAAVELLRDVDAVIEAAVIAHKGRIVEATRRRPDGNVPHAQAAVDAALEAQDALQHVELDGYQPRMRAGIH